MSIALDIGHACWRSLRRQKYRLIGRSSRAAYTVADGAASRRAILERLNVPYLQLDGKLVIAGDSAEGVAELYRVPVKSLLDGEPRAGCSAHDRGVIRDLVETLIPVATSAHQICCFCLSGLSGGEANDWNAVEDETLRQVQMRGYQPLGIGSATAVVLAELGNRALTGVGVTVGAGCCEIALVRHGVELRRAVVKRGGDWIDHRLAAEQSLYEWDAAGNRHLDLRTARDWKESNTGSILSPVSPYEYQLAALYRQLVGEIVEAAREALAQVPTAFSAHEPVSLVCAGGTASRPGFREVLADELRKNPLPVSIGEVRVVGAWEYSAARGCLIRAALEEETVRGRAA